MSLQDRYAAALRLYFDSTKAVQDLEDLYTHLYDPRFKTYTLEKRVFIVENWFERVRNGDFASNIAGWLQMPGEDVVASWQSGRLRLVRSTGSVAAFVYQRLSLIPGRIYIITGDVFTSSMSVRVGSTIGAGDIFSENISTGVGALDDEFEATVKHAYLSLWPVNTSSTSEIDNISVIQEEAE